MSNAESTRESWCDSQWWISVVGLVGTMLGIVAVVVLMVLTVMHPTFPVALWTMSFRINDDLEDYYGDEPAELHGCTIEFTVECTIEGEWSGNGQRFRTFVEMFSTRCCNWNRRQSASYVNVKLSWLNTGQIYRTIEAFGPLQPALVDIRKHQSLICTTSRIFNSSTSIRLLSLYICQFIVSCWIVFWILIYFVHFS